MLLDYLAGALSETLSGIPVEIHQRVPSGIHVGSHPDFYGTLSGAFAEGIPKQITDKIHREVTKYISDGFAKENAEEILENIF